MVRQVVIIEQIQTPTTRVIRPELAFGTHPDAEPRYSDALTSAAVVINQEIRVVLDEHIPTAGLDEVECDDGQYDRIPPGTTDSELAACTAAVSNCSIGICASNGGIVDRDADGRPDSRRLFDYNDDPEVTEYAIALNCDGISIPLDPNNSGYDATGSQEYDESRGLRSLGPSIVMKPLFEPGLRTGATCGISFKSDLADEDGNPICAPVGGVIAEGCSGADLSQVSFSTIPLAIQQTIPADGEMGVPVANFEFILIQMNTFIRPDAPGAISITSGGEAIDFSAEYSTATRNSVVISLSEPYQPSTEYQLTVDTTISDALGGSLPAPTTITWTTSTE